MIFASSLGASEGYESSLLVEGPDICARKVFKSASASLNASLVDFNRCNSSYKIILAGMLTNWARI